ncbi:MAG: hypothetical protein ACK56N_15235 [Betaproteobacteria bacterium]
MPYVFVDSHRAVRWVEPVSEALEIAPSAKRRHAAHAREPFLLSQREQ